jgi:hypothetical protein
MAWFAPGVVLAAGGLLLTGQYLPWPWAAH